MNVLMPFDILSDQKYKCDDLKSYERVELLAVDSHYKHWS